MIELSKYYSDKNEKTAVVCVSATDYYLKYYEKNGRCFHTESFPGRSVYYVEDAAENWALGIKNINKPKYKEDKKS
jgi:hypothetical protein